MLYHLKDPFLALRRLRQLTAGTAVIESATVLIPGWTDERLWMFLEGPELERGPEQLVGADPHRAGCDVPSGGLLGRPDHR